MKGCVIPSSSSWIRHPEFISGSNACGSCYICSELSVWGAETSSAWRRLFVILNLFQDLRSVDPAVWVWHFLFEYGTCCLRCWNEFSMTAFQDLRSVAPVISVRHFLLEVLKQVQHDGRGSTWRRWFSMTSAVQHDVGSSAWWAVVVFIRIICCFFLRLKCYNARHWSDLTCLYGRIDETWMISLRNN